MIKKLREIIIDDFEFNEINQIDRHIQKIRNKEKKLDNLSEALAFVKKAGVGNIVFVDEESGSIRLPSDEFSKIIEIQKPVLKSTAFGKKASIVLNNVEIHSLLSEKEADSFVSEKYPFVFWYSNEIATNLGEFYEALDRVSEDSIKHHLKGNDFSQWLDFLGETEIADEIREIEGRKTNGSSKAMIRKILLEHVENQIKQRLSL